MANNINIIRQQPPENTLNNSEELVQDDDVSSEVVGMEKVGLADKGTVISDHWSAAEKSSQQPSVSYPKTVTQNQDVIVDIDDAAYVKTQLAEEVLKTSSVISSGLKPMHLLFGLLGVSAVGAAAGGGSSDSGASKQGKPVDSRVVETKTNSSSSATAVVPPAKSVAVNEPVLAVKTDGVETNISESVAVVEKTKVETVPAPLEVEKSPVTQNVVKPAAVTENLDKPIVEQPVAAVPKVVQPTGEVAHNKVTPIESKTTEAIKENAVVTEAVTSETESLKVVSPISVESAKVEEASTVSVESEKLLLAENAAVQTSGENVSDGITADVQPSVPVFEIVNSYKVYTNASYGKYVDARDFGSDPSGQHDSYAAIKAALAAAHQIGTGVYLHGKLYISEQLVIDKNTSGVTALFGDGMGKTIISFDKAQVGVFNPNSNDTDIRKDAGILIDGQNGKTIADLSVKYTNKDFYRPGESYFGKVCGILVNDASNTLISKVEVSGVNRAGVMFSSTAALTVDPNGKGKTYKARLIHDEISEDYPSLPVGENNRLVDSYLHHNRVAGAGVAYQKDFIAEGNTFSWNGHEADGGTGYGIMAMAGSYNLGVTFTKNTTDHNYRKGLDVHDGNNIVITDNVAIGDRLYGIAVYNRQFTMNNVKISGNVIEQDPNFRLEADDNIQYKNSYHIYSGIQLQTNTQLKNLHSDPNGYFEISNNTIKNLTLYKDAIQTYAIEFRNHEQAMDYTLNIKDNQISGESTKYLIGIINNTKDYINQTDGPGSGNINIIGNHANIGEIARYTMPIFINEHNTDGNLRGEVTIQDNHITVREKSNGGVEGIQVIGNAKQYNIVDNILELHGVMNHSIISIHGHRGEVQPELNVTGNLLFTDYNQLSNQWIESVRATVNASDNKHNDAEALAEKLAAKTQALQALSEGSGVEAAALEESIGEDMVNGSVPVTEVSNTIRLFDIGSDSVGDNNSVNAQPVTAPVSNTVAAESGSSLTLSDLLDTGSTIELGSLLPHASPPATSQPGTSDVEYLPTLPVTEVSYTEDIGNTVIF